MKCEADIWKPACWLVIIILDFLFRLNFCHNEIFLVFSNFEGHDYNDFLKCGSILTMLKEKKEADCCSEGEKKIKWLSVWLCITPSLDS